MSALRMDGPGMGGPGARRQRIGGPVISKPAGQAGAGACAWR